PGRANLCRPPGLDAWWEREVTPRRRGRGCLRRLAEAWVLGCALAADARTIRAVLPQRLARFGLTLQPTQTARGACRQPAGPPPAAMGKGTCDLLGLTLDWTQARQGGWGSTRRTARQRRRRTTQALGRWGRTPRHAPWQDPYPLLRLQWRGH